MAIQTPKASFFVSHVSTPIFSGTDPHSIMVALAGQPKGWPVHWSGSSNPVSVTTN
ncbi:ash family protein [Citrobacter freundii]|uniref:ash family protein n=1 Tax=Citrobacter freundii TaxID=546 RepID=UPI0028BD57C1|nr:ash family protein [Citrobacter freundii]MDT7333620.1 ash family protein [Citrobacter freundii]